MTGARTGPRVVVVDHHDSYTWNLVHLVAAVTGTLPEVVEHDEVTATALLGKGFSHIVLSPGPGSPDDAGDFSVGRELLLRAKVPVLGVCLGMQGLVSVYGGHVGQVEPAHGEVALVEHDGTGVLDGLPSPFKAVRYHSLAALALSDVLRETAWCDGPDGRVVMGVAHREKPLWGVQFHPESILTEHGEQLVRNFLGTR
jgi:anthranilate synthase component II